MIRYFKINIPNILKIYSIKKKWCKHQHFNNLNKVTLAETEFSQQ